MTHASEKFLQYVWFNKLFSPRQTTTDGLRVEVLDVGQINTDAGADVFNAKIKIGDTLWVGNVEFHTYASDWQRHGHHTDRAYNAVILHVVLFDDGKAIRENQTIVPQLIIKYPKYIEEDFKSPQISFVHCADKITQGKSKDFSEIFDRLISERLENKCTAIDNLLANSANDWEEAFYITTARCFGFGTNADTFEALAKRLPQKILAKHKDNLTHIEALLFGTGGFLEQSVEDEYFATLRKEFDFFRQKYELNTMDISLWKQFRVRPTNFPTIRIAQFASLIHKSKKLFSKTIEIQSYKSLRQYYDCSPSAYWTDHYRFGEKTEPTTKHISKSSIDSILINSVIPFYYAYSRKFDLKKFADFALELLREIPAEKNRITREFSRLGIHSRNALQSQALTELKCRYCDVKRCYICKNNFEIW